MQLNDKFLCQWDRTHSLQSFTILPVKQTEALARWRPRLRSLVWNVSWGLLLQLSAARLVHTIHEQLPFFCCKQSTGSYLRWPLPCLHYYIVHPSCVEKTRGERNTNEEQTVNSHDASEGAKREWGSHQASWIWLLLCSHCPVGGGAARGLMNGLYHTRRPTTAQTNYLTGGFCIGGWPQEHARPISYLFLIHTIAVAHNALWVRWRGMM